MKQVIEVPEGYTLKWDGDKWVMVPIEPKLPMSWEELGTVNGYHANRSTATHLLHGSTIEANRGTFPTKDQAEASIALAQLLQLRQAWVGDWVPDWTSDKTKYVIVWFDGLRVDWFGRTAHLLCFPTKGMAQDFLTTFKPLIEKASPLLFGVTP